MAADATLDGVHPVTATTRQIPWLRVFVESVVIVGSILLAFGIQAWWDGVQEGEEVRQDLVSVSLELMENRERIMFHVDLMDRMASAGKAVVELMESDPAVTNMQDTLAWLGTNPAATLDASFGALEALIASGRLSLVADPDVRLRLAGLRDKIEDAIELQPRTAELADSYLMPLTYSAYDNTAVSDVSTSFWGEKRMPGRQLVSQRRVDFPNSLAVLNFLRLRIVHLSATLRQMRDLLIELDELVELIGAAT